MIGICDSVAGLTTALPSQAQFILYISFSSVYFSQLCTDQRSPSSEGLRSVSDRTPLSEIPVNANA